MKLEILEHLRCPACKGGLDLKTATDEDAKVLAGQLLCQRCGMGYEVNYGLPNLVHPEPEKLPQIDAQFLKRYEQDASSYDLWIRLKALLFLGIWEPRARREQLVNPLKLKKGDTVLEIGAGTGSNLIIIAKQIGQEGKLFALDLSPGMLAVAMRKLKKKGIEVEYTLGNGAYLPYENDMFDAVLHFGAINTFGEKGKAIAEIVRVAKPGAKILIGDEGFAPGRENTWFGRWLLNENPLFATKPPREALPANVEDSNLRWICRGTTYIMEFRKAK
jgi:ubiquinone/menaquinone biosynthesis C-methylase UbiE